jgi:pilus assembly protein CpaB
MLIRNPYLLLGLAAVLGLGAAVMASHWIETRVSAAEKDVAGGHPVVVAAAEIPFGAKITAEQLKVLSWPPENITEGAFSSIDEVIGKIANQKMTPGEAVLHSRAVEMGGGSSLATLISPAKRAISVRVNDVIGVGGFLLPGNRVDVLATRITDDRRAITHTLLQNLKVLAVDQSAQADKDKPVVVRAVTLEVEPAEAELLVGATEEGTVQLAMRSPDDNTVVPDSIPVAAATPRRQMVAAAKPEPVKPSIMVIRQAQVTSSEVKQ